MSADLFPRSEFREWPPAWPEPRGEPRAAAAPAGSQAAPRRDDRRTRAEAAEDWVKERLVDCYNR